MTSVSLSIFTHGQQAMLSPVNVKGSMITSYTSMAEGCIDIFDREYNVRDELGANDWDTRRDLEKIWSVPKIKLENYNNTNTVLIDVEPRKCRTCAANAINPLEFTAADVGRADRTLKRVLTYLDTVVFARMQESDTSDVRNILKQHRYRP
jgi:hypothetical protein